MSGYCRRGATPDNGRSRHLRPAGLPWFDYYDADAWDLAASATLANVKTVGEKLGGGDGPFVPVDLKTVIALGGDSTDAVADGNW